MRRWGNILIGALGLAVLQGVVSTGGAASNVGGFLAGTGKAVAWFVDPAIPAFGAASTSAASSATSAVAANEGAPSSTAVSPTMGQLPGVTNPSAQTQAQGGAV